MEKVKKEVDNNPIITYIYRMKDKEINIKVENITDLVDKLKNEAGVI